MLRFIFASHHKMAEGLKDTIQFLTETKEKMYAVSAYTTEQYNLQNVIKDLFAEFEKDDTVIIMTDIMSGSINQKFYPYLNEKVHLFTGINVPLAYQLVLTPEKELTENFIKEMVEDSKSSIVYVNAWKTENSEDDE
jgi:mannose/fructose-specific phosphotransferase system component IIA